MTNEEVITLLVTGKLSLTQVIDCVISVNGIIGVGLITLGDDMAEYIKKNKGGRRHVK